MTHSDDSNCSSDTEAVSNPPLQIDERDSISIIEKRGGSVTTFEICEEPHYEVKIGGKVYGPMIETELYWFAYGVSLWPEN